MDNISFNRDLQRQVDRAVQRLLSEQDRDPYSATYGCFDRKFWGWKLSDFPEATFQHNVYPLALVYDHPASAFYQNSLLLPAIQAGLMYATQIQHGNGSFDQAFPNECSFGAAAFLLHPLLESLEVVKPYLAAGQQAAIEASLLKAARFLMRHDERHGHIANHLAGAVLSLLAAARYFAEDRLAHRAELLLERILAHQSQEGWFLEYEGADPGYQTLCLYYLAQVYLLSPTPALEKALVRALEFLQWFVHPDGTFGGFYGSRRTSIFYPGGMALLGSRFPLAQAIYQAMGVAITRDETVSLTTIDMGNLAPLLSNYVCALQVEAVTNPSQSPSLPRDLATAGQDFPEAGLFIRGTPHYYAIVGASNGGTLKVFDKNHRLLKWDDGGYVGRLASGVYLTSQITEQRRQSQVNERSIILETPFYEMLRTIPSPRRFIILRLLNLTLMRSVWLGNWLKRRLVARLISGKHAYSLRLRRKLIFETDHVIVEDTISNPDQLPLRWLEFGRNFKGIHMASAGYYEGAQAKAETGSPHSIDLDALQREKVIQVRVVI